MDVHGLILARVAPRALATGCNRVLKDKMSEARARLKDAKSAFAKLQEVQRAVAQLQEDASDKRRSERLMELMEDVAGVKTAVEKGLKTFARSLEMEEEESESESEDEEERPAKRLKLVNEKMSSTVRVHARSAEELSTTMEASDCVESVVASSSTDSGSDSVYVESEAEENLDAEGDSEAESEAESEADVAMDTEQESTAINKQRSLSTLPVEPIAKNLSKSAKKRLKRKSRKLGQEVENEKESNWDSGTPLVQMVSKERSKHVSLEEKDDNQSRKLNQSAVLEERINPPTVKELKLMDRAERLKQLVVSGEAFGSLVQKFSKIVSDLRCLPENDSFHSIIQLLNETFGILSQRSLPTRAPQAYVNLFLEMLVAMDEFWHHHPQFQTSFRSGLDWVVKAIKNIKAWEDLVHPSLYLVLKTMNSPFQERSKCIQIVMPSKMSPKMLSRFKERFGSALGEDHVVLAIRYVLRWIEEQPDKFVSKQKKLNLVKAFRADLFLFSSQAVAIYHRVTLKRMLDRIDAVLSGRHARF